MKVISEANKVCSRGVQRQLPYKVANNAKVMNILAKGLYSDPIKAPIRELGTNAWDSHIAANNTNKPFDVHLPSSDNPTFKMRDYGTGIAKNDLEERYRTYGDSSRSDSNLFTGCMGIGSKSPYAYTDSFHIVSYFNGIKHVYINSKDEDGIPTLNHMLSQETNEPNGFEVSFNVREKDISLFAIRAKDIFQWFPVKPNCASLEWEDREVLLEGKNWKLCRNIRNNNSCTSCAVMGNVAYPIEPQHFQKVKTNSWDRSNQYTNLLDLGLHLYFDIGVVEIEASREGLQYTPRTIQIIKNRLDIILKDIKKEVFDQLKDCKTLWGARLYYKDIISKFSSLFQKVLEECSLEWNGTDITTDVKVDFPMTRFYDGGNLCPKKSTTQRIIRTSPKTRFCLDEMSKGSHSAIRRLIDENDEINNVYLIKPQDKDDLLKTVGILDEELIRTSSLPKPIRQKRNHKIIRLAKFRPNGCYGNSSNYWTKDHSVDFEQGGLYVEIKRWFVVHNKNERCASHITTVLENYNQIVPGNTFEIIGVTSARCPKFEKSPRWTNFFDYIEKNTEDYIKQTNIEQDISDSVSLNGCDNKAELTQLLDIKSSGEFDGFNRKFKRVHFSNLNNGVVTNIKVLRIQLNIQSNSKPSYDFIEGERQILKTYPLLNDIFYKYSILSQQTIDNIEHYINLVDQS